MTYDTKKTNLKSLLSIVLTMIIASYLTCLSPTLASTQSNEEYSAHLDSVSGPKGPIFGKVDSNSTFKVGVSAYRYVPEKIYLHSEPTQSVQLKDTVSLLPTTQKEAISKLDETRDDIKNAEIEGLNFIQPSLALTTGEQSAINEFFTRNEQEQLLTLWESTIERNKTIQYIIERLAPDESTQEKKTRLSQIIGTAIFIPLYAAQALSNNSAASQGVELGTRALGSVLQGKFKKSQTKMQLSQTESIVLFMLIDEVAERLRQRYHNYKKIMIERALATSELAATKQDSVDSLDSKSTAPRILANIQRRAVQREIRRLDSEKRYFKNSLAELAGLDAVGELDKQLTVELAASANTPLDWDATN